MASELIAVDMDGLAGHRNKVAQVGDAVALAKDAAGSVDLAGGAFGVMCNSMVPPVMIVSTLAQQALEAAAQAQERAAQQLKGMAEDFGQTEQQAIDGLSGLQADLDGASTVYGTRGTVR